MKTLFIDGQSGTTGLQLFEKLQKRKDIKLIEISEADRKDPVRKTEIYRESDLVVLCLPDEASKEAVNLVPKLKAKILDASSVHRVARGWVYGLPELNSGQRQKIREARLVSNPGCYPTGFLLAVNPLVRNRIIAKDSPLTVFGISGYSGAGRKLIEKYESVPDELLPGFSFRPYGLNFSHKHLPEMARYASLNTPPLFIPAVANIDQGMILLIPLHNQTLKKQASPQKITDFWREAYQGEPNIKIHDPNPIKALEDGFLTFGNLKGTNQVDLMLFANKNHNLLVARLDNLGKGASGAATQNINLMLGLSEFEN